MTATTDTFRIPLDREHWERLGQLAEELPGATVEVFISDRSARLVVVGPDARLATPAVPYEGDPDGLPDVVTIPAAIAAAGLRQSAASFERAATLSFVANTVEVASSAGRTTWRLDSDWYAARRTAFLADSGGGEVAASGEIEGGAVLRCLVDVAAAPSPNDSDVMWRLALRWSANGFELTSLWSDGNVVSSSIPWTRLHVAPDGDPAQTEVWASPLANVLRTATDDTIRIDLLDTGAVRIAGPGVEALLGNTTPRQDWDAALDELGPRLIADDLYEFDNLGVTEVGPYGDDGFRVQLRSGDDGEYLTVAIPISAQTADPSEAAIWTHAHGRQIRGGRLQCGEGVVWAETDVLETDDLEPALCRLGSDVFDLCEDEAHTPPWFPGFPTTGGL